MLLFGPTVSRMILKLSGMKFIIYLNLVPKLRLLRSRSFEFFKGNFLFVITTVK
jgi:hypothetical protein